MHPHEDQASQQAGRHEMGGPTAVSGGRELFFQPILPSVTKVDVLFKHSLGCV